MEEVTSTYNKVLGQGSTDNVSMKDLLQMFDTVASNKDVVKDKMVDVILRREKKDSQKFTAPEILPYITSEVYIREMETFLRKLYLKQQQTNAKASSISTLIPSVVVDEKAGKELRSIVLKQLIINLSLGDKIVYPQLVANNIARAVVRRKCSAELKFLQSSSQKLLQEIAKAMGMNNYLELSTDELCQAITDMNRITRAKANGTLTKCVKALLSVKSIPTKDAELLRQVEVLRTEVDKLDKMINEWDQVKFYQTYPHCTGRDSVGQCANLFGSMHQFSERIKQQAEECSTRVSKLRRRAKVSTLTKESNIWQKFKAHVL